MVIILFQILNMLKIQITLMYDADFHISASTNHMR